MELNLSESDSESESADFPRFIISKSLKAKFYSLLKEILIPNRATERNIKKTKTSNLIVEVDSQMTAENILKRKTFHTTKYKVNSHEKLNT